METSLERNITNIDRNEIITTEQSIPTYSQQPQNEEAIIASVSETTRQPDSIVSHVTCEECCLDIINSQCCECIATCCFFCCILTGER